MKIAILIASVLGGVILLLVGVYLYYALILNPRVARELVDDPDGERAQKVMLLTLPSGRSLPVNYWRDGEMVYAGADGRWWRELEGRDHAVTVLVRGETLQGRARAVVDDPEYTARIFESLRPNAVEGFGTLIEIRVERPAASE